MSLRLKLENDIYGGNRLQVAAPAQTVKSTVSQVAPASTTRLSVPQPKPNVVGSLSMGSTSSVGVTPVQRSYDDNPVSQTSRILSPVRKVTSQMPSMHQYVKDATDMRNDRIERGFKANKSIQDISNDSGASTNEVLRYKDTYHPTYGDKGLIRNILEGGKNIAVDTFNKAAGIVTKPYNNLTYDRHKANQELININLQRRIGDLTDEAASEKAQQLADKFTNKKVVTDSNGMLAIQQGDTLDYAKKIAQQGVDTSNVVPALPPKPQPQPQLNKGVLDMEQSFKIKNNAPKPQPLTNITNSIPNYNVMSPEKQRQAIADVYDPPEARLARLSKKMEDDRKMRDGVKDFMGVVGNIPVVNTGANLSTWLASAAGELTGNKSLRDTADNTRNMINLGMTNQELNALPKGQRDKLSTVGNVASALSLLDVWGATSIAKAPIIGGVKQAAKKGIMSEAGKNILKQTAKETGKQYGTQIAIGAGAGGAIDPAIQAYVNDGKVDWSSVPNSMLQGGLWAAVLPEFSSKSRLTKSLHSRGSLVHEVEPNAPAIQENSPVSPVVETPAQKPSGISTPNRPEGMNKAQNFPTKTEPQPVVTQPVPRPEPVAPAQVVDTPAQAQARQVQELNATQPRLTPEQVADINAQKALADAPTEAMADLMSEARKYKSAEEFVEAKKFEKGSTVPIGDQVSFEKTLSPQDLAIHQRLKDIQHKMAALDPKNGYKPYKISQEDKAFYSKYGPEAGKKYQAYFAKADKAHQQLTDLYNQAHAEATPTPKQPTPFEQDLQAAGIKPTPKVEAPQATVALEQGMDAKTAQKLYDTYDVTGVPAHVKQMMRDNGARQSDINKLNNQIKQAYAIIEPDKYKLASQPPTPKVEAPKGAPIEKTPDITGRTFYKGISKDGTKAGQGFNDNSVSYMTESKQWADSYNNGGGLQEIKVKPNAKVLTSNSPEYDQIFRQAGGDTVKVNQLARQSGYDIVSEVNDSGAHIKTAVLNPKAVQVAKSSAPIEKTPQVGKPDPTAALKQEALKYGSAEEFADSLNAMKYGKVTGVGQLPVSKINKTQIKALTERGLPHTDTNLKVSDFKPGRQVTQPLEVYSKGGSWVVENGNHRLAQALANGDETVPVVFKGGEGKKYSTPITDLYNQAHAETPTPQAPKPQSSALTNQEQVRQRGFTSSVQNSAEVSKDVRGKVGGEYAIRSTKKLAADADAFASNTISKITKEVHSYLDTPTGSINDVEIARSIATAKRLDSMGRFEDAQAIYDKLAEHGTKGGQAIQAFSLLSNRTPDGIKYSGIKMLKRAGVELDRQGLVEFDKLIQKVRKTNPGTEARDRAVYATYDFVARRVPTTVPDKLVNIWRAGLLTAPRTTTGNILGNTTELVTRELWSNPIAVATDKFISLFTGKRTKTLAGGRMSGVEDGFRHSVDYLRTGYDPRNTPTLKYDTARRLNYKNKTIDRYVNGIYRWMGAQDQPFYYVAKSEAARDLAKADAINLGLRGSQASDYIDAAVANKDWKPQTFSTRMDAVDYGKYAAYQNETLLGNVAGAIKQKAKSTNSVAGAIADYILPFTQVPSSVAMRIVDRTPLGVAKEIVSQIANRKFDQRALAEAIGNGSFGVAVWSAGVSLANAGLITGAYPSDQKERKLWEVEGKQPYSVRIGDRWYSLNYMQPMGTILAIGKQYDDDIKSGKSPEEAWLNSGAVAAKSVESQSFLQGVNGMLSAINQPEVSGSTIANQLTGSLMPNLVRSMNTAADPYQREVNNPLDSFIASLPVARQTLLNTKRDMFGKDITARDNPINLAVNPLRPSLVKGEGDIVVNELRRLQDVKEGIVTTKFDMKSISGVELSDTQVRELDTKINSSVKEVWSTVISDPRYGSLTDSEKADVLKKAKDDVAESIKKQFVLDNGLTTTAKYKDKSLMSAFRGAGSGETYAEDYQSALSEMNSQDVKNWSPVERAKKEKRLRQLSVQKDFEKDTVSLYGMTKNEVYALVSKDPNGKKYVEDILKYGDALVAAGLAKYNKFRDRYGNTSLYASSAGGTGRRVSSRSGKKGGGRRGRRSTKGKFDYKLDGFSKVASTNSSLRQLLKKAKMRQGIA